ncbi:MAG: hypothetical protein NT155_01180 [Candidatus Staskawiczbacteria bacterium]|nr:hypothetical protein [Candidatus Staskawiczbacteria bacterium]
MEQEARKNFIHLSGSGFTIIELIISMVIFSFLIILVATALNDVFSNSSQQLLSLSNIDQARSTLSVFASEIRDATTGSDGSYPLNQAGDSQIIFYSNFNTSNSAVERIRYYVSGNVLYKGVIVPAGSPLSYNPGLEIVKPVISGVASSSSSIFYYYDGNYNGNTSSLSQPVNINQVRFVKISLMILNQITAKDTSSFPISVGAAIRSVKDNLGN